MSLVRVLRTTQVVLTHLFRVDGVPTDAAGDITATLKRLDGSTVHTATATHAGVGTGRYSYTPPAQQLLDALTLDWTGTVAGAAVSVRDFVEIVGGFIFDLSEAAAQEPPLDATKYPLAVLAVKRIGVEQECERISGTTWVPRFTRIALPGGGRPDLLTPHADLRALRAARIDGTDLTAPEVAAIGVSASGVLTRPGGTIWPYPGGIPGSMAPNIVLEYEHGRDAPTETIREAAMVRLRTRLTLTDTGVPYQAISFTAADGGTYRMSTPGAKRTGIPEVDAAYLGDGQDLGGFA